jgi:hypothetical protein
MTRHGHLATGSVRRLAAAAANIDLDGQIKVARVPSPKTKGDSHVGQVDFV